MMARGPRNARVYVTYNPTVEIWLVVDGNKRNITNNPNPRAMAVKVRSTTLAMELDKQIPNPCPSRGQLRQTIKRCPPGTGRTQPRRARTHLRNIRTLRRAAQMALMNLAQNICPENASTPCANLGNLMRPKAMWDWDMVNVPTAGFNWQPFVWKKVKWVAFIPELGADGTSASGATLFLRFIGGVNTDEAGHVLGKQWGGSGARTFGNVFPQERTSNRSAMNLRDNAVKRLLGNGPSCLCVKITLLYSNPMRPHRPMQVRYEVWEIGVKSNDPLFTLPFNNP